MVGYGIVWYSIIWYMVWYTVIYIRILPSGSKTQNKGIPETMVVGCLCLYTVNHMRNTIYDMHYIPYTIYPILSC